MYGIVNNGLYDVDGRFEAAAPVGRGVFVTPSYVNKTAAVPVADGVKDVYFVLSCDRNSHFYFDCFLSFFYSSAAKKRTVYSV